MIHTDTFKGLPACLSELMTQPRWVGWVWEERINKTTGEVKMTKPPKHASGRYAHNDKPETWATYGEVEAGADRNGFAGVGLQLLNLTGFGALDLDKVRDKETGAILYPWAADLIACGSYAEVTPSGTGFRVLGRVPDAFQPIHRKWAHPEGGEVEIYANTDTGRYITVTGNRVTDAPDKLAEIGPVIDNVLTAVAVPLSERAAPTAPPAREWSAPGTDRSGAFQSAVNRMRNAGLTLAQAESALRADPDRTGAIKYLEPRDRLPTELMRSWDKAGDRGTGGTPGDKTAPVPAFKFTAVGDLEYRDPEFLVADLIETDGLGLIFGDPGSAKSFLAVDLALCVASGADFHGKMVKQGPVLFIAGEGHNGLARRFAAWSKERGVSLKGLPMFKSERAAQFLDGASAQAVAEAADALAQTHGAPQLIVIDTLARNFGAGDENSTQDMNGFVVAIDDLKARWPGCVILIVHHSGHAEKGRARGAMALKGALDFEYRVEKEGSAVQFINTKMKDAPEPPPMFFTLENVELGPKATSAVLQAQDAPERTVRHTPAQKLALATYETAALAQGVWDGGAFRGVHVDHWREAFYAKHTGDNYQAKKKSFQRVRSDLVEAGTMTVTDDVYLVKDATVQTAIMFAPRPPQEGEGTRGTLGDIGENVPVQKSETGGHGGHVPKACPHVPPDLGHVRQEKADKRACPPVPLSRRAMPDPDAIRAAFDDYAATDNPKDERAWQ